MAYSDNELEKLQNKAADLRKNNAALKKRIKSLESALLRTEQGSKIKSNFLENMSHEIRTSMNGIVGVTGLLLETELNEEQEQYLEMVDISVSRLLEVVNEVLDYSKIEAGDLTLEPIDFNLKESLDHDLYLLRIAAEQKGITLSCYIDSDVPEYIFGDSKRLVQIVTNLVNNGIKQTDSGGVTIYVKNDGYDDNNRLSLHFSIQDTGRGIDLEMQKQIFHTFSTGTSLQAVSEVNVGIGLTVCSQLVKMMGGEIGLASSKKGSNFWFSIPFREVAHLDMEIDVDPLAVQRQAETAVYALKDARVLLAEDEHINRVLTETLLTNAGVVVDCVEDGCQAVEMAAKNDYQIILMDVQMPRMDGLEATRKIRAMEKEQGRKGAAIIALTALAMQGDRERGFQAGMDDYLIKPIEKSRLLEMVTKYLSRSALVVDSDIQSQHEMVRTLVENGWNVTIAESGRAAMYEASLNQFDIILLDTAMGEINGDGIEAARVIRKLEYYSRRHACIIGIGQGGQNEEEECLASGFDGYIGRPVTGEKVKDKLELAE